MRWRVVTAEEMTRCGARPGPRSTARCEQKPRHWSGRYLMADTHSGRTRGGYWKFWAVTEEDVMAGWGRVAYEAYLESSGGKSAVSGEDLPSWEGQSPGIRHHWEKSADAVIAAYLGHPGSMEQA